MANLDEGHKKNALRYHECSLRPVHSIQYMRGTQQAGRFRAVPETTSELELSMILHSNLHPASWQHGSKLGGSMYELVHSISMPKCVSMRSVGKNPEGRGC